MNLEDFLILGLSPKSNQTEVKKAYKKLANIYHPDKDTGDIEMFKKISTAYRNIIKEPNLFETFINSTDPTPADFTLPITLTESYFGNTILTHLGSIVIPKGIDSGETLIHYGKFIEVEVDNGKYKRSNLDLLLDIEIDVITAAIGDMIVIEHFNKEFSVNIPSNTLHGDVVEMKNYGMIRDDEVGDLFIRLHVVRTTLKIEDYLGTLKKLPLKKF
jgi:DnaJ-class molecular chaperone